MKLQKLSSNHKKLASLVLLAVSAAAGTRALAAPANEIFSSGSMPTKTTKVQPLPRVIKQAPPPQPSNPVAAPGAMSMMNGGDTPAGRFFEAMDDIAFSGFPRDNERFILQAKFNEELEKVERWTSTAKVVAKRYRDTARALRAIEVPDSRNDLAQYKDMRAEWFDNAADVYEQMYKPKRPAQTMEELEEQLAKVDRDADTVAAQKNTILSMDRSLRKLYRVHADKHTDSLTGYVQGDQNHK